ncbi:MAG: MerR family transcriptional regulator [Terracidiphilus sp.]
MSQASRKHTPEAPVIPDRLYFKIGDVARICGIEPYVLRFWETQFPQLKPNKSGTGQRLYRKRDVELVLEIQRLLHKEGFTIPGARQALDSSSRPRAPRPEPAREIRPAPRPDAAKKAIAHARTELKEIAAMLAGPQPPAKRERGKLERVRPGSDSLFPL